MESSANEDETNLPVYNFDFDPMQASPMMRSQCSISLQETKNFNISSSSSLSCGSLSNVVENTLLYKSNRSIGARGTNHLKKTNKCTVVPMDIPF